MQRKGEGERSIEILFLHSDVRWDGTSSGNLSPNSVFKIKMFVLRNYGGASLKYKSGVRIYHSVKFSRITRDARRQCEKWHLVCRNSPFSFLYTYIFILSRVIKLEPRKTWVEMKIRQRFKIHRVPRLNLALNRRLKLLSFKIVLNNVGSNFQFFQSCKTVSRFFHCQMAAGRPYSRLEYVRAEYAEEIIKI